MAYGYGPRTYEQGLAKVACKMNNYIVKHDRTLKTYLPAPAYSCLGSISSCLVTLCELLNKSAT